MFHIIASSLAFVIQKIL